MDADEAAFLRAVADADDPAPALVYADWLDDHGRPDDAAFVRDQCRAEALAGRDGESEYEALRDDLEGREADRLRAEQDRLAAVHPDLRDARVEWRRGVPDALLVAAEWFARHGEALRECYPSMRRLVVFRLNGRGERLAACPALAGLREVEFPCWYGDEDAEAVAASPYLSAARRVVYWGSGRIAERQCRILAAGTAWPQLSDLHLVTFGSEPAWRAAVDEAAGRAVASAYVFDAELFPFAVVFSVHFLVGRLPGGTQLFLPHFIHKRSVEGAAFDADGTPRDEPFRHEFPPDLVYSRPDAQYDRRTEAKRERDIRAARVEHLRRTTGFEPAFIRVKPFETSGRFLSRLRGVVENNWGNADVPSDGTPREDPLGNGRAVYDWVRGGYFVFAGGTNWECDGRGRVIFT